MDPLPSLPDVVEAARQRPRLELAAASTAELIAELWTRLDVAGEVGAAHRIAAVARLLPARVLTTHRA